MVRKEEKKDGEEKNGEEEVEMRGLEAVWRGASRHQCLIICLPKNHTKQCWGKEERSSVEMKKCG